MEHRELLYSLKFYLSARQVALTSAFSARCQLSPFAVRKLQADYSTYLVSVVSAIDLVREASLPTAPRFIEHFESSFSFQGFADGRQNHGYLRELRNAVVHRGLDLTAECTVFNNFPVPIPPHSVSRMSGKETFTRFGNNLLDVIWNCEHTVGPAIREHLLQAGLLPVEQRPATALREEMLNEMARSEAMPEEIKRLSKIHFPADSHFLRAEASFAADFETALNPFFEEALKESTSHAPNAEL